MSIFGKILSKIFPSAQASTPPAGSAQPGAAGTLGTPGGTAPATGTQATALPQVDVEAILNDMASKNSEKLNWRTSIVDLMKLLGLDSSFAARKELAQELKYTGDSNDSASMNIWLHKQVMQKLAQNGGKVPEELK